MTSPVRRRSSRCAGPSPIELDPAGVEHPRGARAGDVVFTPTPTSPTSPPRPGVDRHEALGVILGRASRRPAARSSSRPVAPHRAAAGWRRPARPNGRDRAHRQRRAAARPRGALAAVCVAVFFAQLWIGPDIQAVGNFTPQLFLAGDVWRIVTANLIHGSPSTWASTCWADRARALVERPLGAPDRDVMGLSGVAAMLPSGLSRTSRSWGFRGWCSDWWAAALGRVGTGPSCPPGGASRGAAAVPGAERRSVLGFSCPSSRAPPTSAASSAARPRRLP